MEIQTIANSSRPGNVLVRNMIDVLSTAEPRMAALDEATAVVPLGSDMILR